MNVLKFAGCTILFLFVAVIIAVLILDAFLWAAERLERKDEDKHLED